VLHQLQSQRASGVAGEDASYRPASASVAL
jgi:hypothetical protein